MKNILFGLFLCTLSLPALEWLSFEKGIELQKDTKKIMMIDVVRTDCHFCTDMEKKVFDDPQMAQWIKERFVPVKVNLDKEKIPFGIKTNFTPSFFFVNSNGDIVKKIPGSWNIEDFKSLTKGIK